MKHKHDLQPTRNLNIFRLYSKEILNISGAAGIYQISTIHYQNKFQRLCRDTAVQEF